MIRLLIDENVAGPLVAALSQRLPELDFDTVQELGKTGAPDPELLAWSAEQGRVLLTSDKRTIPPFAKERIIAGLGMPGIIILRRRDAAETIVDDLELLLACGEKDDFDGQIWYVPL